MVWCCGQAPSSAVKYEVPAPPQQHGLSTPRASPEQDEKLSPVLHMQATPAEHATMLQETEATAVETYDKAVPLKEMDLSTCRLRTDSPVKAIIHVESEMLAEEKADDTKDYDVSEIPDVADPVTPTTAVDQADIELPTEPSDLALDTTASPPTNLADRLEAAKDTSTPKTATKGTPQHRASNKGPGSHPIKSPSSTGNSSTKTASTFKPGSANKTVSLPPNSARKTLQKTPSSSSPVTPGPNAARPTAASVAKRESAPHVTNSPVWKY